MDPSSETPGIPRGYQDRKAGLVVFGILTLLFGLLFALFAPLMLLTQSMASANSPAPHMQHAILPAVLMYAVLAVVFIWLGIGSILARRWARALLLVLSSSGLAVGILAMGMMFFMFPQMSARMHNLPATAGQPAPPPEMGAAILGFMMVILLVIYVIIPGVWVLFYRSPHVKATCEALDPVERWTDRAPLPVIAASLWMACMSAAMLLMAPLYNGVIPAFGVFLSGPVGIAVCIIMAVLFGYCAWALYKLKWSGWWIVVAIMCIATVSVFLTYSRHDISELYALMGYSGEELAQIQKFNFLNGKTLAWQTLGGMVPTLGFLLFLRRYFPQRQV